MLLSWLGRAHTAAAALVLLFLGAALLGAARDGFRSDRDRYRAPDVVERGVVQL